MFKEADLAGHLSNGNTDSDANSNNKKTTEDESSEEAKQKQMLAKDFQLQEALNLLKALDILKFKENKHAEKSQTDESVNSDNQQTESESKSTTTN